MKRLLVIFICVVAIVILVQEFDGVFVRDGGTQVAEKPYRTEEFPPISETKKEFIPEKTEIISTIPPGNYPMLKLGTNPVSPINKNTVAKLQEEARRTGLVIYENKEKLLIKTQAGDGKWYRGGVEPGTIFLSKIYQYPKSGVKEYELIQIPLCRNPVQDAKIRVLPPKIIEKTKVTIVIKERYRDIKTEVDYTPALWTALGGLLVGGIIGLLIRPRKKTPSV